MSKLKSMEVINLKNNEKLGFPCDLEICVSNGEVSAIIIPEKNKNFLSFKSKEYRIPWCAISAIGEDIILINADCFCYEEES